MEKDSHRYTEKDLHNVVTYETGLQILYGIRKLRETEPISARTQPVVKIEGKKDLPIDQQTWQIINGTTNGAGNELRLAGKGCIVREIAQKYK